MATVAHVVRSNYDPKDRERLEILTGQIPAQTEAEIEEEWQIESSAAAQRQRRPPPSFVPATVSYDPWTTMNSSTQPPEPKDRSKGEGLADWYRSVSVGRSHHTRIRTPTNASAIPPPNSSPLLSSSVVIRRHPPKDWFIQNALASEPKPSVSPSPTLNDMLTRHPPPLPSEPQFKPKIFLALGPSNKGFSMLQQQGWSEGEPLGPHVRRLHTPITHIIPDGDLFTSNQNRKAPQRAPRSSFSKAESQNQSWGNTEVIDLTVSDAEDITKEGKHDAESDLDEIDQDDEPTGAEDSMNGDVLGRRTALITPIATVLKADRLGIGLKAKTVGPYKASKKRITHSAAALAAHKKAAERLRLQKLESGRGRRGFERAMKKEHAVRQQMLTYMNS